LALRVKCWFVRRSYTQSVRVQGVGLAGLRSKNSTFTWSRPHYNLSLICVSGCEISASSLCMSRVGSGVDVRNSRDVALEGNETARNAHCGIGVTDSQDVRIAGNLAEGNLRGGIIAEGGQTGLPRPSRPGRSHRNNGGGGIEITHAGDAVVQDNSAWDSGRDDQGVR
jgi:parallel beta-helix repeat protein